MCCLLCVVSWLWFDYCLWLVSVVCFLFVVQYVLRAVCCYLVFVFLCSLFDVRCALSVVCCTLFVVRCLLFVVACVWIIVRCVGFGILVCWCSLMLCVLRLAFGV